MIEVRFISKENNIISVSLRGHAGYDDYGKDIVCSAVTSQVMMIYNGLESILKIPLELEMEDEGGYLSFSLKDDKDAIKAQVLMKTLYLGLNNIREQYKNFIKLIKEEV